MKKYLIGLCLILCAAVSKAQSALAPSPDTLTNVDTSNMILKIPGAYNEVLTFQLNVTKLSGTTAGSAYVQGSLDGVNYFTLPGTDTLTFANSNNFKVWVLPKSQFLWYRVRAIGSGTQSTKLNSLVLFR